MSADRPEPEPEPETEPDPTRRGATSPGAGGTSSAPASAEERLQYQILHTGMKFLEEVWNTAAKPMSEYLHSTADKAADTASTAILEKVKNIRRKYTTLKARMAKVYKQMSDNSRRLSDTIGLIQTTSNIHGRLYHITHDEIVSPHNSSLLQRKL
jgi:hypothetical protein